VKSIGLINIAYAYAYAYDYAYIYASTCLLVIEFMLRQACCYIAANANAAAYINASTLLIDY
jgi:hypothetical protein